MKTKISWIISAVIILAIILFAIYIKTKEPVAVSEELTKCIAQNSIVYSQIGCRACESQEEKFGEYKNLLNNFLCNSDNWKTCREIGITGTPTWFIDGEYYKGVQSIEKLKELTRC